MFFPQIAQLVKRAHPGHQGVFHVGPRADRIRSKSFPGPGIHRRKHFGPLRQSPLTVEEDRCGLMHGRRPFGHRPEPRVPDALCSIWQCVCATSHLSIRVPYVCWSNSSPKCIDDHWRRAESPDEAWRCHYVRLHEWYQTTLLRRAHDFYRGGTTTLQGWVV